MSNLETDNNDDGQDIPSLRSAAKAGKAAISENERLKRELLFAKAGIDTDSKLGGMLFKTWEGEDLEALRAEGTELGLFATGSAPDVVDPANSQQSEFRQQLATGSTPGATKLETPDPLDDALIGYHKDVKGGMSAENARLVAIDKMLVAASSGDKRVIYDPSAARLS